MSNMDWLKNVNMKIQEKYVIYQDKMYKWWEKGGVGFCLGLHKNLVRFAVKISLTVSSVFSFLFFRLLF